MSVDNIDRFLIQTKRTYQLFVSPFILGFQKSNPDRNSLYRAPIVLSIQFNFLIHLSQRMGPTSNRTMVPMLATIVQFEHR